MSFRQKGLTLVEVAIVLVILGLLIGLGASLIGPLTKRAKLNETREIVKQAREAILGFIVTNKRLPNETEFRSIVKTKDAWGNDLFYYSDGNLTSGDACCSDSNGFRINDKGTLIQNAAFIILSKGENRTNDTGQTPDFQIQEYSDNHDDIVQYVTISELKDKILSCQSLEIISTTLPEAEEDTSYFTKIIGKGGCNPQFSLSSGSLPSGLSLSQDGIVSGTVNVSTTPAGTLDSCYRQFNFNLALSAPGLQSITKGLTLVVKPQTLRITNSSDLPTGAVNGQYSVTLYGSGGKNSYNWSISSGSLPPGLNLNNGVISGIPTSSGVFNFVVSLNDTCSITSKAFTITIAGGGPCTPLSLNPTPGTTWQTCVGQSFSRTVTVSGGQTPLTNTACSLSGNCAGLTSSCGSNIATVSGTLSQTGICTFNVAWRDSCSPTPQTISGSYTINISPSCPSLSISPASGTSWNIYEGNYFSQTINVSGGSTPISNMSCSFGCDNHVSGIQGSCSSNSATIWGTPTLTNASQGKCTLSATWRDSCSCGTQTISGLYTVYINPQLSQIAIVNQTGSSVFYRKGNDTTCYQTANNACIVINPGETVRLYPNSGQCNTGIHSCSYTYNQLKQLDSNGDGNVRLWNIQQSQCNIDDSPTVFCI